MDKAKSAPLTRLQEIGHEDKDTMLLLIDLFLQQTPELLHSILEASKKEETLATKNAAHTLKGVCMNLGFDDMVTLCIDIEQRALSAEFSAVSSAMQQLEDSFNHIATELTALKEEAS